MTARPRIAVLGAGWVLERAYLPHLRASADVVAAHDIDPARARALAAQLACSQAVAFEDCLAPDVEGVILAVPPAAHASLLPVLLAAGKRVLCEKPVARGRAELAALAPFAAQVMGSATTRLRRDVQTLLGWAQGGALGRLQRIRLGWWRGAGVPAPGSWRTDARLSPGGVLDDLGPHLLDVAAVLLAPDESADLLAAELAGRAGDRPASAAWFDAAVGDGRCTAPDTAHLRLRSRHDLDIEVELSWCDGGSGDASLIELVGSDGVARLDGLFGFSTDRRLPTQRCELRRHHEAPIVVEFAAGPALQEEAFGATVTRFARFCRGQDRPIASFAEVARVAGWLEDARRDGESWRGA